MNTATMTNEEKWAKVNELALALPAPSPINSKDGHMAFGKAAAEIYFQWFPAAEFMIHHTQFYGSFLYLSNADCKVCTIYELGAKRFNV